MNPQFFFHFPFQKGQTYWKRKKFSQFYLPPKIVTSFCRTFLKFFAIFYRFFLNESVKLKEICQKFETNRRSRYKKSWEKISKNSIPIGVPINYKKYCEKNFKKVVFFYRRKGSFDFAFPIKMSFFANFQNYCRKFTNSSFDRKFHTEKL